MWQPDWNGGESDSYPRLGTTENVKVAWFDSTATAAPTWSDQNLSGAAALTIAGTVTLLFTAMF